MSSASKSRPGTIAKARGAARAKEPDMSVILRDTPPGHGWGWFSREDPRMHLQTVDREHYNQYKVWLERAGRRVFEPANKIPAKVLKRLEVEVQERRVHIEGRWVNLMIDNRWIELKRAGSKITIVAYPHVPSRFTRTLDLREWFRPEALALIGPDDVILSTELPAIEVWPKRPEDRRHHLRLSTILWQD